MSTQPSSAVQMYEAVLDDPRGLLGPSATDEEVDILKDPEAPEVLKEHTVRTVQDRDFFKWVQDNYSLGEQDLRRTDSAFRAMKGEITWDEHQQKNKENSWLSDLRYQERNPFDIDVLAGRVIQQTPQLTSTLSSGLAMGAGFSGAAFAAGSIFGPEAGIPSAGVAFELGAAAGAYNRSYELQAGSIYEQARLLGASHESSVLWASAMGTLTAGIELAQLASPVKFGVAQFKNTASKTITKESLKQSLKPLVTGYLGEFAKQELEEVAQSVLETFGAEMAKYATSGEEIDIKDLTSKLTVSGFEAMVQSIGPSAFFPAATGVGGKALGVSARYASDSLFDRLGKASAQAAMSDDVKEAVSAQTEAMKQTVAEFYTGQNTVIAQAAQQAINNVLTGKTSARATVVTDDEGNIVYTADQETASPLDAIASKEVKTEELYSGLKTTGQLYTYPSTGFQTPVYQDAEGDSVIVNPLAGTRERVDVKVTPGKVDELKAATQFYASESQRQQSAVDPEIVKQAETLALQRKKDLKAEIKNKTREIQKLENEFTSRDAQKRPTTAVTNQLEKAYTELSALEDESVLLEEAAGDPLAVIEFIESGLSGKIKVSPEKLFSKKVKDTVRQAKALRSEAKKTRQITLAEVKDVQTRLRALVNSLSASPEIKSQFLNDIVRINTIDKFNQNIDATVSKLEKFNEKYDSDVEKKRIDKLLDRNQPKKRGRKPVGNLTAEAQVFVDSVKKFTKDKNGLAEAQNILDTYGSMADLADDVDPTIVNQVAAAELVTGFDTMDSRQLQTVADTLEGIITGARKTRAEILANRKAQQDLAYEAALSSVNTNVYDPGATRKKGLAALNEAIKNGATIYQFYWDNLTEYLTPKDPDKGLSEILRVEEASQAQRYNTKVIQDELQNTFSAIAKKFGYKGKYHTTLKDKLDIPIRFGTGTRTYTRAEALGVYIAMKDPDFNEREALRTYDGFTFTGEAPLGQSTEEFLDSVLTDGDKAMVDAMFEFTDKYYNRVNAKYRAEYGIDLPKTDFYFPRQVAVFQADNDLNPYRPGLDMKKSILPSSTKSRVGRQGVRTFENPFIVLSNHVRANEHWIAWSETAALLNRVVNRGTEFQTAIRAAYGQPVLDLLKFHVSILTRGSVPYQTGDKFVDAFMSRLAPAKLGFGGVRQAAMQLSSISAYWASMKDRKNVIKAWGDLLKNGSSVYKTLYSNPIIRSRYENSSFDSASFFEELNARKITGGGSWSEIAMLTLKYGDMAAVLIGGYPVYYETLNETGSPDLAMAKLIETTESTQQSNELSRKNYFQMKGKLQQVLFNVFIGPTNLLYQKTVLETVNYFNSKPTLKTAEGRKAFSEYAKKMAFLSTIPALTAAMVRNGFGAEEEDLEDYLWAATVGASPGAMIAGPILESFLHVFYDFATDLDVSEGVRGETVQKMKNIVNNHLKRQVPVFIKETGGDLLEMVTAIANLYPSLSAADETTLEDLESGKKSKQDKAIQEFIEKSAEFADVPLGLPIGRAARQMYDTVEKLQQGDVLGAVKSSPVGGFTTKRDDEAESLFDWVFNTIIPNNASPPDPDDIDPADAVDSWFVEDEPVAEPDEPPPAVQVDESNDTIPIEEPVL